MQLMENTTVSMRAAGATGETANQRQASQTRQAARRAIVQQVEHGMTAQEARLSSPVPMHRTTVYRLLKRVQCEGEQTLVERRHGYPTKLRGEVLTWMLNYCQSHISTSSSEVQRCLTERFGLSVSVSQLNRVRAAHDLSRKPAPPIPREKKAASWRHHCPWIS